MPKRNVGRLVHSLFDGVVKEAVRGMRRVLPSEKQIARIEKRLRDLDRSLSRLATQTRRVAAARRGRGGRPRVNPATCSVRGCKDPARAKALCSRHYQQRRRHSLRRRK